MIFPSYKSPEEFLDELEITSPNEIDVEALAFMCGAVVVYEPLKGCEAYLVATGTNRAIITVNDRSLRARQRFSVAHELGHWMRDRGQTAFCKKDLFTSSWYGEGREARANRYAKELLLPEKMFAPLTKNQSVDYATVEALAAVFGTSLTATALRLVELGPTPSFLICSKYSRYNTEPARIIWYSLKDSWNRPRPKYTMSSEAAAYELCLDEELHIANGTVQASAWFDHPQAQGFEIRESSFRINCNMILTLLSWEYDDWDTREHQD